MKRLPLLAALVAGAAVSFLGMAASAMPTVCAPRVRAVGLRLPAAVRVTTSCAIYTVSRGGRVSARASTRPSGGGVTWMAVAGNGAAVIQRGSGVAVLAHGRTVWRSHGRFRAVGVFATVSGGAVAFSYESFSKRSDRTSLYVAAFGGRERRVAVGERPLGWVAGGELLSWRYRHGLSWLYLRDSGGGLLRRVSGGLREVRFDRATRTVLAITGGGLLERYRNGRWSPVANLRALGLDRQATFERLAGGLIGLLDGRQVAVLRQDGSLFASARFRSGDVAGESGLIANTAGTAVAFVVTQGTPAGAAGRESVQLLRVGDRRATTLHNGSVPGALCVRWTTLAWHGEWLLYSVTAGETLLLDTASRAQPLDLTRLVHDLVPHDNPRSIAWA